MATQDPMNIEKKQTSSQSAESGIGYKQITEMLLSDIHADNWRLGGPLPTEAELAKRFRVSRHTVRASLSELEALGYIKRRRGTKSILVSKDPNNGFENSVSSINELLQYSKRTSSQLLNVERIIAGAELADQLRVKEGSQWLCIEIIRNPVQGSKPIGFSKIYVDTRYDDIIPELTNDTTVYDLLEEKHNLVYRRIKQTLQAASANANVASRLVVPIGSPILFVRTEFIISSDEIVVIGLGHFPAERYRVEIELFHGYAVTRLAFLTGDLWLAGILSVTVFAGLHVPFWGAGPGLAFLVGGAASTAFFIWRQDLLAMVVAHVAVDAWGLVVTPLYSEWWKDRRFSS